MTLEAWTCSRITEAQTFGLMWAGSQGDAMADDPLAITVIRHFEHARTEAIEIERAYGGRERVDGTAGYAAELAESAGLTSVATPDATRIWVKDPSIWNVR